VGESVGHGIITKKHLVADVVVHMCKEVSAEGGGDNLAAVVVGESGINRRDARCPSRARRRAGERVKGIAVGVDKRRIEVGCAVRHEVAAALIAVDKLAVGLFLRYVHLVLKC